jgi:hypothetical protein
VLDSVKKSLDFKKEVEIFGVTYTIKILSLTEEQKANSDDELENLEGSDFMNRLRINVLSYAIEGINDQHLDPIVEIEEKNGDVTKKERSIFLRELLSDLPTDMVELLFDAYVDIKEEAESKLKERMNYKWFKDPKVREQEMKERLEKLRVASGEEMSDISFREIKKPEEETEKENIQSKSE